MGWETDRALVRAWRAGDDSAGEVLVREHYAIVRRFFASKTPEALDDLVQSTFLSCVRSQNPLKPGVRFRAMILGFARVELLRYLRKRRRLERRMGAIRQRRHEVAPPTSPSGVIARNEKHVRLRAAVDDLALPLRLTVELRYFEGLSVSEVADSLGIAQGTVKSRLSRARKLIRRELGPGSDDQLQRPAVRSSSSSESL